MTSDQIWKAGDQIPNKREPVVKIKIEERIEPLDVKNRAGTTKLDYMLNAANSPACPISTAKETKLTIW